MKVTLTTINKINYFALKMALAICLVFSTNVLAGTSPINWLPFLRAIFLLDQSGELNMTQIEGTTSEEVLQVELAD